jgi:hypothetical protein
VAFCQAFCAGLWAVCLQVACEQGRHCAWRPATHANWCTVLGLPSAVQALVALPSYLFVETFQALLPLALGFAAGCMVWIVCAELMPDALESAPHPQVATAATLSAAWWVLAACALGLQLSRGQVSNICNLLPFMPV